VNLLVLQLKRIGDLVLTTPALAALRHALPDAQITLLVAEGCEPLLPAIDSVDEALVFRGGAALTKTLLLRRFDVCLDFTGNDRSAFFTLLSKAPRRITFGSVRKSRARALLYNEFSDSAVRDFHTVDHYLHLLQPLRAALGGDDAQWAGPLGPVLHLPPGAHEQAASALDAAGMREEPFAILHPGSARPEKYWEPACWIHLVRHLREKLGVHCVLTGGTDAFERAHLTAVTAANERIAATGGVGRFANLAGSLDLLGFAALVERARLVVSCDTAIVHLASAFRVPQVALFGPTNPFHWRPRHERAIVFSAAQPEGPLHSFDPHMKGASMRHLSTEPVIRATEALLSDSASRSSS
jgi:ADP-heptose:LPS heptosyltransferase